MTGRLISVMFPDASKKQWMIHSQDVKDFCNLALWKNAAIQLYCSKSGSCGKSFADPVIDAINVFFSPQFLQVLLGLTLRIWLWWWIISSLWLVRSRAFHLLISAGSRMGSLSVQIPTLLLCLVRNLSSSAAFRLSLCLVCYHRARGPSLWGTVPVLSPLHLQF